MKKNNKIKIISWIGFVLFFGFYLFWVIKANTNLIDGRFQLFFDEQKFSYDGINNIYNSSDFFHFLLNVMDGNNHVYGRILWNISALTSYIPYEIWGYSGQVIATRLTQVFFLFAAYSILVWTFIKNSYLRILSLILLLILPFTAYYASMPKPEPLQLFFLVLFLRYIHLFGFKKSFYWIFLGLAFGTKISLLPFVGFLFLHTSILLFYSDNRFVDSLKLLTKQLLYFASGYIIAIPILAFGGANKVYSAIFSLSAKRVTDSVSNNILNWIKYIFVDNFAEPIFISVIMIIFIFSSWVCIFYYWKKNQTFKNIIMSPVFLIILCGLSFILPIMLFNQWVQGFYLHNGTVLLVVGSIACYEVFMHSCLKKQEYVNKFIISLCVFVSPFIFFQSLQTFKDYEKLSMRTESIEYKRQYEEYKYITSFLTNESLKKQKKLLVSMNAYLLQPSFNKYYNVIYHWSGGAILKNDYDVIVFYDTKLYYKTILSMYVDVLRLDPINNKITDKINKTFNKGHLIKTIVHKSCIKKPCYREILTPLESIRIFAKDE